jgi:hypothetical protein
VDLAKAGTARRRARAQRSDGVAAAGLSLK